MMTADADDRAPWDGDMRGDDGRAPGHRDPAHDVGEATDRAPGSARSDTASAGPTRRGLFAAAGVVAAAGVAGVAGWSLRGTVGEPASSPSPAHSATSASSTTAHVALTADLRPGITAPSIPQRHASIAVLSLPGVADEALHALAASALAAQREPDAGEVTVTVGFAPARARALWPERAAAVVDLPEFAGDAAGLRTGGDLLVQVCAETASGARDAMLGIRALLGQPAVLWEQTGYRDAPSAQGTARTSSGFVDGIINPRATEELAAGVWTSEKRRDTHMVVRRMLIDPAFTAQPVAAQEQAIGRRRDTGAPLSGGKTMDQVDLLAKYADGTLLTPLNSHARRAHPSNIGRPLMLRRSYSFDPPEGAGLLFIAFLSDPQTFIATQQRLDEADDLIAHTSTDASGCFFVPGDLA